MKKLIKSISLIFINRVVLKNYTDGVMTIQYESGRVDKYKGKWTIWHKLPNMKRCGTMKESWLCDLWMHIENITI